MACDTLLWSEMHAGQNAFWQQLLDCNTYLQGYAGDLRQHDTSMTRIMTVEENPIGNK